MSTQASLIEIVVHIDRDAAVLAGLDEHGVKTHIVKPSELSEAQRRMLVKLHYVLYSQAVGAPITGAESIPDLLDKALQVEAEKQAKIERERAEAVETMTAQFLAAPLADQIEVDLKTGVVTVHPVPDALVTVDRRYHAAKRLWQENFGWHSRANGNEAEARELRQQVFNAPAIAEKIDRAEIEAQRFEEVLALAKATRDEIRKKFSEEQERQAAEAQKRRTEQLAAFVADHMGPVAQKRLEAHLLPEADIIHFLKFHEFTALDRQFEILDRDWLDDQVHAHCLEKLGCYGGDPVDILYIDRALESLDDERFLALQAIDQAVKEQYPDARVEPIQLVGYLEDFCGDGDPEYCLPIVRVTVQVGEIEMTREYRLDDAVYSTEA